MRLVEPIVLKTLFVKRGVKHYRRAHLKFSCLRERYYSQLDLASG